MPDFYHALVNNQYTGLVQFKPISIPGTWLGNGNEEDLFPLVNSMTKWRIDRGGGSFGYHGHQEEIHSYWIYCANRNMCWQAENYGRGRLKYWNWDGIGGQHDGKPQDFELFTVEAVNPAEQTVIIYNTAYGIWYHDMTGDADLDPHIYISLVGDRFACNAKKSDAVVLQVVFG